MLPWLEMDSNPMWAGCMLPCFAWPVWPCAVGFQCFGYQKHVEFCLVGRYCRRSCSWVRFTLLTTIGSIPYHEVSGYLSGLLFSFARVCAFTPGRYLQIRWFVAGIVSLVVGFPISEIWIARISLPGRNPLFKVMPSGIYWLARCIYACFFNSGRRKEIPN